MQKEQHAQEGLDAAQVLIASGAALLMGLLYLALPDVLQVGPPWGLLVVEVPLLVVPVATGLLGRHWLPYRVSRAIALALVILLLLALIASLALLIANLPTFHRNTELLRAAGVLWVSNVLVFGIWHWEVDGGGPAARLHKRKRPLDLRFPQQEPGAQDTWKPGFVDYLFAAFCFATALSPADTLPLSRRAKLLTMLEAVISLLIIVLLVARAVNITG